jgi:hypothetical protein
MCTMYDYIMFCIGNVGLWPKMHEYKNIVLYSIAAVDMDSAIGYWTNWFEDVVSFQIIMLNIIS